MTSIIGSHYLQPQHGAVFHCPLCEWTLTVPPVMPAGGLDAVFGPGVLEATANVTRLERIERDLYDHLTTHTMVQWINRVRELERQLAQREHDMREG